jgi:hypothetical protein
MNVPDPIPLVTADHTLRFVRRYSSDLCNVANNLCHAIDRLSDLPPDTEAEASVNNAVTALEFALSAATEKRDAMLRKRKVQSLMRPFDQIVATLVGSE